MISAALLVAYGVTIGTWGAGALRRARWTALAPKLAIAAWQAVAASVLLSLFGAGVAASVTVAQVRGLLAGLLHVCARNLDRAYASPGSLALAATGLSAGALVLLRILWCGARLSVRERRQRRKNVAMLDLIGRHDILPGVLVLDHPAPYAFCIGGKHRRVVVTDSLLQALDHAELQAVLAHEAAHLKQRHHIALSMCRILFLTLSPLFPAFRETMASIRLFAELSADDSARRHVGAPPLRSALDRLACLPTPTGTLAATANDVEMRLLRLTSERVRLPRALAWLTGLAIVGMVLVPMVIVVAPGAAMALNGLCLVR